MPKLSLEEKVRWIIFGASLLVGLLVMIHLAAAQEKKYAGPDLGEYYRSLMMPDAPRTSCCGEGDRYWADKTESCTPADYLAVPNCALVAIITDTGPNVFDVKDDKGETITIRRDPIPVGTRIIVPASKIRKPASANPTTHNIIFTRGNLQPYCWEPAAGI